MVVAGAVVLPYFAVIIANGGSDTRNMIASESMIDELPAPAIEAPRARQPGEPDPHDSPETAVLHGELADDEPPAGPHDDKAPPSA